jgi:hypothetical protein
MPGDTLLPFSGSSEEAPRFRTPMPPLVVVESSVDATTTTMDDSDASFSSCSPAKFLPSPIRRANSVRIIHDRCPPSRSQSLDELSRRGSNSILQRRRMRRSKSMEDTSPIIKKKQGRASSLDHANNRKGEQRWMSSSSSANDSSCHRLKRHSSLARSNEPRRGGLRRRKSFDDAEDSISVQPSTEGRWKSHGGERVWKRSHSFDGLPKTPRRVPSQRKLVLPPQQDAPLKTPRRQTSNRKLLLAVQDAPMKPLRQSSDRKLRQDIQPSTPPLVPIRTRSDRVGASDSPGSVSASSSGSTKDALSTMHLISQVLDALDDTSKMET